MGNPLRSLTTLNHRLDHDLFEDVAKVHYKEGIIKNFGVSQTDPITLDDTCTVEVEGSTYAGVPIFYHCRPGYYDSQVATRRADNKALNHAAWGFRVGHKVVVALREYRPLAVLSHNEGPVYGEEKKAPWPCVDIIRLQWHLIDLQWFRGGTVFPPDPAWIHFFYKGATQKEYEGKINGPGLDPAGKPLLTPHRARHIFGKVERQMWENVYYMGDWMVRLGPVAYIFVVYCASSMLGTGVYGVAINVFATIWKPELEASWLATAAAKELRWEQANPLTPVWDLLVEFPYQGMVLQKKFTDLLNSRFGGGISVGLGYAPKWLNAEFWVYDWDRVPSVPGTPNTPGSGQ